MLNIADHGGGQYRRTNAAEVKHWQGRGRPEAVCRAVVHGEAAGKNSMAAPQRNETQNYQMIQQFRFRIYTHQKLKAGICIHMLTAA